MYIFVHVSHHSLRSKLYVSNANEQSLGGRFTVKENLRKFSLNTIGILKSPMQRHIQRIEDSRNKRMFSQCGIRAHIVLAPFPFFNSVTPSQNPFFVVNLTAQSPYKELYLQNSLPRSQFVLFPVKLGLKEPTFPIQVCQLLQQFQYLAGTSS